MAQSKIFQCASCENCVEAWDDGNPYYIDLTRSRQGMPRSRCKVYAYHPEIPAQPIEATTSPTSASTATMSFEWTPNGRERPVRNAETETSSTLSARRSDVPEVSKWFVRRSTRGHFLTQQRA